MSPSPAKKIVVLGGCGGIGSVCVEALAGVAELAEVVVADLRRDAAQAFAAAVTDRRGGGSAATFPRLSARAVDADSPQSLAATLAGADVVVNCVGPFYRFGPPILRAAIAAGVDYVDVCDDLQPTREMLALSDQARDAGVRCLLGMGNSPGLANVLVRFCADNLLASVEAVDIMHIHGGEPTEGPAVVKHRIRAMLDPVPLFIDGRMIEVMQLEESGQAQVIKTDFRGLGEYPVYPYPHPETITLPQHIPGLRRATNMGVIFPLSYFRLTQEMGRVGACGAEPIQVQGQAVVPIEFSVAHILSRRRELLDAAGVEGPAGCLKVVVSGLAHGGAAETYIFSLFSTTVGAGAGTGIPAAAGAMLMARGRVEGPGVLPPEAAVQPLELLMLALEMGKRLGRGGHESVVIERRDAAGVVTRIPLPV